MDFAVRRQDPPAHNGRKRPPLVHEDGTVVHVTPAPYLRWSSGINRVLAVILLVPGLPVIGLLILAVRMTSKGPGIYRQVRVGYHGRLLDVLKIRTMREDAEVGTGAVWTTEKDPRITRLGTFLRLTHLDELPQLFNVLRGEMSLIGPRPERPEFTEHLAVEIPDYLQRINVRPGVTGLAQINLPPDTDTDSVRLKLILDLDYIREAGLGMDLRILACTFFRMLGIRGTLPAKMLGVRRRPHLPALEEADARPAVSVVPRQRCGTLAQKSVEPNGSVEDNGHSGKSDTDSPEEVIPGGVQTNGMHAASVPARNRLASR